MAMKPNPKNIVKIGKLKQIVSDLESKNFTLKKMMQMDRSDEEPDADMLKSMSINQSMINKYKKMIANPAAYKPKYK